MPKLELHTSKFCYIYFRFVSQTIGVEWITFPSHVQNLLKIGNKLWM